VVHTLLCLSEEEVTPKPKKYDNYDNFLKLYLRYERKGRGSIRRYVVALFAKPSQRLEALEVIGFMNGNCPQRLRLHELKLTMTHDTQTIPFLKQAYQQKIFLSSPHLIKLNFALGKRPSFYHVARFHPSRLFTVATMLFTALANARKWIGRHIGHLAIDHQRVHF
jgi:hypothetical protein